MIGRVRAPALAAGLVGLGAGLAACGVSLPFVSADDRRYLEAGEALIEGELADQIGLGALAARCEGRGLEPGDTFRCTGTPTGRRPVEFVATVSADGEGVDLVSTNLLLADQVEEIETFAAALIADDTGLPIGDEHFECADTSVVVAPGEVLDCLVTDPVADEIHTVAVTVDDLDSLSVTVDVGDPVG